MQLAPPRALDPKRVRAVVDRARSQRVIYDADWPLKVYPLGGPVELHVGATPLALRAGDARELRPLLRADQLVTFAERVVLGHAGYLRGPHRAAMIRLIPSISSGLR